MSNSLKSEEILSVALSKGRLQDATLELLGRAGVAVDATEAGSRKLVFQDRSGRFQFFVLKPVDVPTYVEYGVADLGVAGWDVLLESEADVHQPLDLGIGRCIMAVAGPRSTARKNYRELSAVRIATKYPRITTDHFTRQGVPVEIITLSGSVELAPRLGLSERIVDLVATGRTLADNGLEVIEPICDVSARLIVNRAGYQMKRRAVSRLIQQLADSLNR
jgi:ATP phosphoribosyltransferase